MAKVNKKAQATIFMIIGLIVLIGAFFIFFAQRLEVEDPVEITEEQKPEFAGQTELKSYVDECLQDVTLQGLEIMRLQSGYIDIPADALTLLVKDKENKQIKIIDGSKKVVTDPDGIGNDVPYWLTPETVSIPSLSFMERELERYVTNELGVCVNDFKPFRDQKFEVSYSDIITNVNMGTAVVVSVDYPITLRREGIEFEEINFILTVPIDMELIQKLASDLTVFEDFYTYAEEHTKNLISLYSGIDENKLPPFYQSTTNFDCDFVTWEKDDVKNRLKSVLNLNVPNLKVKGTSFSFPQDDTQEFQAVYDSFVYDLFEEEFSDVNIDFSYETDWEFLEYDVKPNNGNLLEPERVVGIGIPLLPQICVFKYPFKYTVQYPFLVKVNDIKSARIDPDAEVYFGEEGYTFQFPMVAYLCGNQNRNCTEGLFGLDSSSFTSTTITIPTETLFCKPEQRISNDITIRTFDSLTTFSLPAVDVNYYCGSNQNDCFIGRTDSNGILKTKFPLCINGHIYFTKNGHTTLQEPLTVYNEEGLDLSYFVNPVKSFRVIVSKIDLASYLNKFDETSILLIDDVKQDLGSNDRVFITSNVETFYLYPDPDNRNISLTTSNYNFDLILSSIQDITLSGSLRVDTFVSKNNLRKENIEFFVFEEVSVLDPIILDDVSLRAELLYQCNVFPNNTCNFDDCSFASADGRVFRDDYVAIDSPPNCKKVKYPTLAQDDYNDFVRPRFS